jgi:phytoene dehydrogenase-like protein
VSKPKLALLFGLLTVAAIQSPHAGDYLRPLTPEICEHALASAHKEHGEEIATEVKRKNAQQVALTVAPSMEDRTAYTRFLVERYGIDPAKIKWGKKYPFIINGGDEASFLPPINSNVAVQDSEEYDAVIVGGGLSGLTAGLYMTDAKKKVLILERDPRLGGLAAGSTVMGFRHATGSAYFSPPSKDEYKIFQHIGVSTPGDSYRDRYKITYPIDSYLWNGRYYRGLWEDEKAVAELPASFALFRHMLEKADGQGLITVQPMEEDNLALDKFDAATWIRSMPSLVAKMKDPESKKLYRAFLTDERIKDRNNPMQEVLGLTDIYCRSALGGNTADVSALAFANFYSSEIGHRYTGTYGSGDVAETLIKRLKERPEYATMLTGTPVAKVVNNEDHTEVTYVKDGVLHKVRSRYVVWAAQAKVAAKLIENFAELAPEHKAVIDELEYANYAVNVAHVNGHPWFDTYDVWTRDDATYHDGEPTDIINGRYQDQNVKGYSVPVMDNYGVLSSYHPIPKTQVGRGFTDAQAIELAEASLDRMKRFLDPVAAAQGGRAVEIFLGEINRWPLSIHIAKPGHMSKARVLRKPIGRIYMGNNNLGTPAVEEALYRGHSAAIRILRRMGVPKPDANRNATIPQLPATGTDGITLPPLSENYGSGI